jgi:glycosyltransferase involved in cell wall biosynthesis
MLKKALKIALWNNLPSGGGKRAFYELAAGLKRRGHQLVSWCAPTAHRDYLPLEDLMPENVVEYDTTPFQQKYNWEALALNSLKFRKEWAAMEDHCRKCADEINAGSFDILFSGNCWTFAVPPIAKYIQCPSVIYHGEPKRNLYEARPKLPWVARPKESYRIWPYSQLRQFFSEQEAVFSKRIEAREELDSLLAFDLILVNSAFSRENLLRSFNLDAKVSYLGINTQLFKPLGYKKEKYVIGLGGIQPHKGINLAIEAISTIPLESRPKLMWVGNLADNDYLRDMKLLASNQGVSFEVHILISDLKLVELLNKASLLLYTSHLEPFGFAPLEANACGTPVVAVAEGGVRETVQSGVNGFLVPDRNPIALGKNVFKLLHDDQEAERISNNCVRSAQNWSWDAAAERVEMHIYQNIMNVN